MRMHKEIRLSLKQLADADAAPKRRAGKTEQAARAAA